MAKKPMTKSQIVSHFAGKFEVTKKTASAIIDEVAALAVSETKKAGSFTLPGIGKLVLSKRRVYMGAKSGERCGDQFAKRSCRNCLIVSSTIHRTFSPSKENERVIPDFVIPSIQTVTRNTLSVA